jgi:hypothetical protein
VALALLSALTGCAGWGVSGSSEAGPESATTAVKRCPVTLPDKNVSKARRGFNYGNASIRVALWPKGKLVAGPLPDGAIYAEIKPDGSIEAKLGWWRGVAGRLSVKGVRLDRPAPRLRAHVPDGYGKKGFQPTGLTFPTTGCWRVEGSVGRARLSFVVLVTKR